MTTEQKNVLRKIIYAVETGDQTYGKQNYSDFTEAYTNNSDEHAITIGAGQWYAEEAQMLLKRIHDVDTAQWDRLDSIGLWEQVQNADWSCFNISRNSQFANLIVQLISSKIGVKCQNNLMDEQITTYASEIQNLGVLDVSGQAMCVSFRHQGGLSAVERILAKTEKPYTLDNLYTACQTDTGNQVGAYKSRQRFVYNSLKKYFPKEEQNNMTKTDAINKLLEIAKKEVGYLEKASNSQLDSKTANAGSSNFTKYWRDIYPSYQGQPWCACFVTWCFVQAFGKDKTKQLLKHYPYTYCPTMKDLFTLNSNPKVGDIVIFYRNGQFAHTGIVTKVSGDQFWTVEGNTSGGSTIVANGGGVFEKNYYNSKLPGTKFCTPDYSLVETINTAKADDTVAKKQSTVAYVARMKKDSKCYTASNTKSPSKLFPKLKKGAVVDVMKYTETDSSGLKWYFVRIPYPNDDGFVFEFVPKGVFTRISEISK